MHSILMVTFSKYQNDPRVRREAEYLSSINYRVAVICLAENSKDKEYTLNKVKVYPVMRFLVKYFSHERHFVKFLMFYFIFGITVFIKTLKLFLKRHWSIIHFHNPPEFLLIFLLPFKFVFGSKIILDRHEYTYLALSELLANKNRFLNHLLFIIEGFFFKFCDRIIVISRWDKKYVAKRGILNSKIFILPNALDEKIFFKGLNNCDKTKIYKRFNISPNSIKIVYQGLIAEERSLEILLVAVKMLHKRKPNIGIELIFVGDGPYLPKLKQIASDLGISHMTHFIGRVSYEKLACFTQIADICFIAAKNSMFWEYSYPNKILEYMSLEKPVLACDFISWREIGEDALFFFKRNDPENLYCILMKILSNPSLLNDIKVAIRRTYKKKRWSKIKYNLKSCYESLLKAS